MDYEYQSEDMDADDERWYAPEDPEEMDCSDHIMDPVDPILRDYEHCMFCRGQVVQQSAGNRCQDCRRINSFRS